MSGADQGEMFRMLLDEINDTLLDFESRCLRMNTENPKSELNDMFRFIHNIKGASRIYGLVEFGSFIHNVEDLLDQLRNQPQHVDDPHDDDQDGDKCRHIVVDEAVDAQTDEECPEGGSQLRTLDLAREPRCQNHHRNSAPSLGASVGIPIHIGAFLAKASCRSSSTTGG